MNRSFCYSRRKGGESSVSATWRHCNETPTWCSPMRKFPSASVQENRQRKKLGRFGRTIVPRVSPFSFGDRSSVVDELMSIFRHVPITSHWFFVIILRSAKHRI